MIRRPPRSTPLYSSAASDVYKRQLLTRLRDAANAVLRTIERGELHARRAKDQVDGTRPLSVSARMIGEETDALALDEMNRIREEHLDAGNDAGGGLCGGRHRRRYAGENEPESLVECVHDVRIVRYPEDAPQA